MDFSIPVLSIWFIFGLFLFVVSLVLLPFYSYFCSVQLYHISEIWV